MLETGAILRSSSGSRGSVLHVLIGGRGSLVGDPHGNLDVGVEALHTALRLRGLALGLGHVLGFAHCERRAELQLLAVAAVLDLVDIDGSEGLRSLKGAGLAIGALRAGEKVAACVGFLLHVVSLHCGSDFARNRDDLFCLFDIILIEINFNSPKIMPVS